MKQKRSFFIKNIDLEFFFGDVSTGLKNLTDILNQYSEYTDLRIEGEGYENLVSYSLWGTRLETDEEYETRIKLEARHKKLEEQKRKQTEYKEKLLYEKLKQKYEQGEY